MEIVGSRVEKRRVLLQEEKQPTDTSELSGPASCLLLVPSPAETVAEVLV